MTERLFSDFGTTHSRLRNRLHTDTVHKVSVVRKAIRQSHAINGRVGPRLGLKRKLATDNTPSGTLDVPQHQHQPLHLPPPSLACHCLGLKMSKNPTSRGLRFPLDSLFLHMQYVAHPNPDSFLYTTMIRACALRVLSLQPVRAPRSLQSTAASSGLPNRHEFLYISDPMSFPRVAKILVRAPAASQGC